MPSFIYIVLFKSSLYLSCIIIILLFLLSSNKIFLFFVVYDYGAIGDVIIDAIVVAFFENDDFAYDQHKMYFSVKFQKDLCQ